MKVQQHILQLKNLWKFEVKLESMTLILTFYIPTHKKCQAQIAATVNITDLFLSSNSSGMGIKSWTVFFFFYIVLFLLLFLLQQPHHILQKRLLEAKMSRGRMNMCGVTTNNGSVLLSSNHLNLHKDENEEDEDFIYVPCKVREIYTRYPHTSTVWGCT